jgi:hypothetical protein
VPTIIAHHEIDDVDRWLASSKRDELFGPLGITNVRTFTNPQNPAQVGLVMDVPDVDALVAALETDQAAAAMEHDGVRADTLVMLVEA